MHSTPIDYAISSTPLTLPPACSFASPTTRPTTALADRATTGASAAWSDRW